MSVDINIRKRLYFSRPKGQEMPARANEQKENTLEILFRSKINDSLSLQNE